MNRSSAVRELARNAESSRVELDDDNRGAHTIGSFHPLTGDDPSAPAVLFAYAIDTPEQQRAIHGEAMARLNAASSLSEALMTMQIDDHDKRSHARVLEAIAILSRNAKGLIGAITRSLA
jgi:hypothetical protein